MAINEFPLLQTTNLGSIRTYYPTNLTIHFI